MHDNPSAFPSGDRAAFPTSTFDPGMTLRDYFAGQIITGYLSEYQVSVHPDNARNMARLAYQMADAMLAARKEQPNADR